MQTSDKKPQMLKQVMLRWTVGQEMWAFVMIDFESYKIDI